MKNITLSFLRKCFYSGIHSSFYPKYYKFWGSPRHGIVRFCNDESFIIEITRSSYSRPQTYPSFQIVEAYSQDFLWSASVVFCYSQDPYDSNCYFEISNFEIIGNEECWSNLALVEILSME